MIEYGTENSHLGSGIHVRQTNLDTRTSFTTAQNTAKSPKTRFRRRLYSNIRTSISRHDDRPLHHLTSIRYHHILSSSCTCTAHISCIYPALTPDRNKIHGVNLYMYSYIETGSRVCKLRLFAGGICIHYQQRRSWIHPRRIMYRQGAAG